MIQLTNAYDLKKMTNVWADITVGILVPAFVQEIYLIETKYSMKLRQMYRYRVTNNEVMELSFSKKNLWYWYVN